MQLVAGNPFFTRSRALLPAALLCLLLPGCLNNGMKRRETGNPNDPAVYQLREDDEEMQSAVMVAQHRFREFREAYAAGSPRDSAFMLKVPVSDSAATEHMWIRLVSLKQDTCAGILADVPEVVGNIQAGDTVVVMPADLTDWSYAHDGRLVGNFSTRVIRRRMEPKERAEFDRETGGVYAE